MHLAGCRKRFDSELQLMEHANTYSGGLKPYMCEEDGCQRAYCCRSSLQQHMKRVGVSSSQKQELKSPKDKRRPVAKTSLTPLRYYGGTCSRSAHSNHESKTNPPYKCTEKGTEKDSTARGRMQADLLLQTIPSTAYEEGASEKAVHHGNREILRPAALLSLEFPYCYSLFNRFDILLTFQLRANSPVKLVVLCFRADMRRLGKPPVVGCGFVWYKLLEDESALVWFGMLAMALALGYIIYKAIMMRKKEQTDRKLLKEYLGKFPDEPAPPGHTAPLKWDVLHAMFKRS
ncbi:hypothetical protein T4B_15310 [Trichinella pseudospiralis]|uniref:C2H2-type domain-containing protein n=1 Tax=Trichinella pseudospiralis TaxID=6337 RepID=A0A0V1GU19_TRIPS|nr:hypothetical protein T4B_15310 [Trichinella pseudospiralis]